MATATAPVGQKTVDTFPINGTDYIEFWVGNAKQSALYYRAAFGYTLKGYRGPETGVRDRASYLLEQGKIRLVLTSALGPEGEIAAHVAKHGDGVRDMAFWVDDARDAHKKAIERGAVSVQEPTVLKDADGEVIIAGMRTYGDTIHSIVERRNYKGLFLPGFQPVASPFTPKGVGLKYVDHCVGNVELGKMNTWVDFYSKVLGFFNLLSFDDKTISTEYSALMSKVMSNGNGRIKFPINEPAKGQEEVADRGVSRLLPRPRRAAHRRRHRRHHRHGAGAQGARRGVPLDPPQLLRDGARPRGEDRRGHRAAGRARHPRGPRR